MKRTDSEFSNSFEKGVFIRLSKGAGISEMKQMSRNTFQSLQRGKMGTW